MKKKLCLFLCLVIIVTALASVAFARDEICSYCNARVKFYDTSDTYLLRVYSTLATIQSCGFFSPMVPILKR